MKTALIALLGISALTACTVPVPNVTQVEPQGLPTGTRITPVDIGDDGTIVVAVNSTAALLQEQGTLTQFPLPAGYTGCTPARRAKDGTIVGTCSGQSANSALESPFAVFWDASGAVHEIDTGSVTKTSAVDINDEGVILGYANGAAGRTPWIYDLDTNELTVLSVPENSTDTLASAINDRGDIVGTASFAEAPTKRPVMWTRNTLELRFLASVANLEASAMGINNQGVIVGQARDALSLGVAVVWSSATALALALPFPAQRLDSVALRGVAKAINDAGQIIGEYAAFRLDYELPQGALWTSGRLVVGLPESRIPVAINAAGRVVATGGGFGCRNGVFLIDW